MSNIIQFQQPLPDIESYPIYHNKTEDTVTIPIIPDNRQDAATVLGSFMALLREDGILNCNDILQIALQATGQI